MTHQHAEATPEHNRHPTQEFLGIFSLLLGLRRARPALGLVCLAGYVAV